MHRFNELTTNALTIVESSHQTDRTDDMRICSYARLLYVCLIYIQESKTNTVLSLGKAKASRTPEYISTDKGTER